MNIAHDPAAGWREALDRGEADRVAWRLVDGRRIHSELRATIKRMESGGSAGIAETFATF